MTQKALEIGGRYNWIGQPERLIYIGRNRNPGQGRWRQFVKVDEPEEVWCEVLDSDLHLIEETQNVSDVPVSGPVPQPLTVNFEFESLTPLEGMDRIYAEYAKTFGRYPDPFMAQVVGQTKEDLFVWWGAHREKIRAALAAVLGVPVPLAGGWGELREGKDFERNAGVAPSQPQQQSERIPCATCTSEIYCEMNGCKRTRNVGVQVPEGGQRNG